MKSACQHEFVDTGMRKTWCRKCDITGHFEKGTVHVTESGKVSGNHWRIFLEGTTGQELWAAVVKKGFDDWNNWFGTRLYDAGTSGLAAGAAHSNDANLPGCLPPREGRGL